jgi:hypothetical protein
VTAYFDLERSHGGLVWFDDLCMRFGREKKINWQENGGF